MQEMVDCITNPLIVEKALQIIQLQVECGSHSSGKKGERECPALETTSHAATLITSKEAISLAYPPDPLTYSTRISFSHPLMIHHYQRKVLGLVPSLSSPGVHTSDLPPSSKPPLPACPPPPPAPREIWDASPADIIRPIMDLNTTIKAPGHSSTLSERRIWGEGDGKMGGWRVKPGRRQGSRL
ncbi:hypothetical protein AOLI_G00081490 [Acnodon oligacanthus]